jgi:Cu/Ag efflux protein CusF
MSKSSAQINVGSTDELQGRSRRGRVWQRVVVALAFGGLLGMPARLVAAQQSKGAHAFSGKVEAIDTKAKTLTVNGENVEGWMAAMTMSYKIDKPDIFKKVKTGDQISATVYDGDFQTLHDVKVVPQDKGKAPKK